MSRRKKGKRRRDDAKEGEGMATRRNEPREEKHSRKKSSTYAFANFFGMTLCMDDRSSDRKKRTSRPRPFALEGCTKIRRIVTKSHRQVCPSILSESFQAPFHSRLSVLDQSSTFVSYIDQLSWLQGNITRCDDDCRHQKCGNVPLQCLATRTF